MGEQLKGRLDIPVFHDDQHGTAIVVLAGLLNAAKVLGRQVPDLRVVVSGAGAAGVAGGWILFMGILRGPLGGVLAQHGRRARLTALSLAGTASGAALLAVAGPFALSALGALVLGLAAGLPFAVIFAAAQRARPDAPAAAIALVNACAVLTILVGTPLAGLTFELPSDGRLAFAAIASLPAVAAPVLPRAPP